MNTKKGFTLLELLIVIGILAILATATVLVLNPAELLKQARDSQRITDLSSLSSALNLYVTTVPGPLMATSSGASNSTCFEGGGTYTCYADGNSGLIGPTCNGRFQTVAVATSSNRQIDGGGWLPVKLSDISGGSPIPQMPTDPSNTATLYYAYACNNKLTYVLTGTFESLKYSAVGNPAEADGGSSTLIYEIGTTPGLNTTVSSM